MSFRRGCSPQIRRWIGARAEFLEAVKRTPGFVPVRLALAEIGLNQQRPQETLRYADEVLAIEPANPRARLLRCAGLMGVGKQNDARSELNRLTKELPQFTGAQLQLGLLALSEKKFKEAESIFRKFYQPGRPDTRPVAGLAEAYAYQTNSIRRFSY